MSGNVERPTAKGRGFLENHAGVLIRILQRYVFVELMKIFILTVTTLSFLMFLVQSVVLWHKFGLSIGQLAVRMPFLFPTVLTYSLPMAMLATCTFAYGRLASDNEILAVQAAGIHAFPIAAPALVLGLALCPLTLALCFNFIPSSAQKAMEDVKGNVDALIKKLKMDKMVAVKGTPYTFRIREAMSDRFIGVDIYEDFPATSADAEEVRRVTQMHAREGYLRPTEEPGKMVFDLYDVVAIMKDGPDAVAQDGFRTRRLPLIFELKAEKLTKPSLLTYEQLWDGILRAAARRDREKGKSLERALWTEIHARWGLSFTCLAFAMVGVPLGIFSRRGNFAASFAYGCIPVFLMYYPMLIFGKSLAESGGLPPALAMWMPIVMLMGVGGVLMWILFRR